MAFMRMKQAAFWQAHFCLPECESVSVSIEVYTCVYPLQYMALGQAHINLKGALQNSRDSQASINTCNQNWKLLLQPLLHLHQYLL